WLGYQNSPMANSPLAPSRNAEAYLDFLTRCEDEVTSEHIESLASEPRNKNRGAGGTNLWDRATRYLTLRETLHVGEDEGAEEYLERIFDDEIWVNNSSE